MKRLILSILLLISLLTFSACISKVNATDEQSDALAEYMAGLLLKYDSNYNDTLIQQDIEDNSSIITVQTDNKNIAADDNTDALKASDKISAKKADEEDSQKTKAYSLTEITQQKNFDISYSGYKLAEFYPENPDKTYISIEADKDCRLLIIKFKIKNKTKKEKRINLSDSAISYQLDLNGEKIDKPWFTVFENDLQYINMKIKGKANAEAILIYQIPKEAGTENMKLIVSNDEKELTILLK